MKSLYKIENEFNQIEINYRALIQEAEINEGELSEDLEEALTINSTDKDVQSIVCVDIIKVEESYIERIDAEIKRLQGLKKQSEYTISIVKRILLNAVNLFGNFEAGFLKFSTRKSTSVDVFGSLEELPKEYKTIKVTTTPDKMAIKKALESGIELKGCELIINNNLQIK